MLRMERNHNPFQVGFQNIRAQTCNMNFRLHKLATDLDLTKEMKWFRNSHFPEKRVTFSTEKDRTYADIRLKGLERQRTFGGFGTKDKTESMSLAGTKMDVFDGKRDEPKLWSQELSRSLPSVAECVTPISLPLHPPLKQRPPIKKSHTTMGSIPHDKSSAKGKSSHRNTDSDKKHKTELTPESKKIDEKLPSIGSGKENEIPDSGRHKSTQTSAKRPDGGWKSLRGESRSSRRSSRSRRSNLEKVERIDNLINGNIPKFLPQVQSAREENRKNESILPIQPLPNLFTPANAPTLTPCNTLASGATPVSLNTLTPESRNSFAKIRRAPVPFKKAGQKTFLD